jgi:hypothetical protein
MTAHNPCDLSPKRKRKVAPAVVCIIISDDDEPKQAPLVKSVKSVKSDRSAVATAKEKSVTEGLGVARRSDERDRDGHLLFFTTEGDTDRLTLTYEDAMCCLSQRQRDEYNLTAKADGRTWHMAHGTCPDMEVVDMELQALDEAHMAHARKLARARRKEDDHLARVLEKAKRALLSKRDAARLAFTTGAVASGASGGAKKRKKSLAAASAGRALADVLRRLMPGTTQESAEIQARHFLRLVRSDFETLTVEGLVQCGNDGLVARAVVSSRQFWTGCDITFATAPSPRFIEALLAALQETTGIDVEASQAMELAMREHEERARKFVAAEFPGIDTELVMEIFAAVAREHEIAASCEGIGASGVTGLNGLGGLIESKEDLATACNTAFVDRALDCMFRDGNISAPASDSVVSAIRGYLRF